MSTQSIVSIVRFSCIAMFLHLTAACAPTVNVAKLSGVNKLAVIGYTATVEKEDSTLDLSAIVNHGKTQDNAIIAYRQLTSSLQDHLKWDVLPYEDVIGNPHYQTVFEQTQRGSTLAGLQSAMASVSSDYHPKGIIWALRANSMNQSERDELLDALGVDAVASAQVYIRAESSGFLFFTTATTYSAQVAFRVWARGSSEEIWKDLVAQGDESDLSGGIKLSVHGISVSSQDQQAYLEAVQLGYQALLERYDEAKKKAEAELN